MTRSMPLNCLLSNLLHLFSNMEDRLQKWFMHLCIIFVFSSHEEHKSSRSSCPFAPKDQNKLFTHDKNRKRVELWVRTNLYNVFVMYALDLAHVKV